MLAFHIELEVTQDLLLCPVKKRHNLLKSIEKLTHYFFVSLAIRSRAQVFQEFCCAAMHISTYV